MPVGSGISFILSSMLSIVLFSGMQMYRHWLAGSAVKIIFGGYLSSVLFFFILTALVNVESVLFGKGFQGKLFPEILLCLALAVSAAGMIHRVCITTCILFSIPALYYMDKISQKVYSAPAPVVNAQGKRKKGN